MKNVRSICGARRSCGGEAVREKSRLPRILASFDLAHPIRRPAELMRELGVSRASIYRDLADLEQAGLLERVAGRGYALGPLIVELDRQIRLADPLINAAGSLLPALATELGATVLLCRLHAGKVLCVHQEHAAGSGLPVSYERGRAMPLYRGATSKIILAHLTPAQLQIHWQRDREQMIAAGLAEDFTGLCHHLSALRTAGLCVASGEVDEGLTGFAVPLLDGPRILGSLSVVVARDRLNELQARRIRTRLIAVAGTIESRVESGRQRPARQVVSPHDRLAVRGRDNKTQGEQS